MKKIKKIKKDSEIKTRNTSYHNIKIDVPTKYEIIKEIIESHGGIVEVLGDNIRIVQQPKELKTRFETALAFTGDNISVNFGGINWTIQGAIELREQLQIAIDIVNEYYEFIETYEKLRKDVNYITNELTKWRKANEK